MYQMVKIIFLFALFYNTLYARNINVYKQNCVSCHNKLPGSLDKFFFDYLLKYSSERLVKQAMIRYLKHPEKKKSVASEKVIRLFGIMPKSSLSDTNLHKAIDTYWQTYKVFGKIQ